MANHNHSGFTEFEVPAGSGRIFVLAADAKAEIERLTRELDALKRTREQEKDYADTCYENERLTKVAKAAEHFFNYTCAAQPDHVIANDDVASPLRLAITEWLRGRAVEPPATPVERLEPDGRMYRWCQHGAGFGVKCPTCFGLPACPECGSERCQVRTDDDV